MNIDIAAYGPTIWAMGLVGGLLLVQLLIADLVGLKAGHVPGKAVEADPRDFLFRATRAHANTNESIAGFILISLFAMASPLSPFWVNALSGLYLASRIAHMASYYVANQPLRSIAFGVSLLTLFALLIASACLWVM